MDIMVPSICREALADHALAPVATLHKIVCEPSYIKGSAKGR